MGARNGMLLCLIAACGGNSEWDPEREALFRATTTASSVSTHACDKARGAVTDALHDTPQAFVDALHDRIAHAELSDVQSCLTEVRAYDECYAQLSCEAFPDEDDRKLPAWFLGSEMAPCGCGVVERHAPFATVGILPESLAACRTLLPLARQPPRPGESGACVAEP